MSNKNFPQQVNQNFISNNSQIQPHHSQNPSIYSSKKDKPINLNLTKFLNNMKKQTSDLFHEKSQNQQVSQPKAEKADSRNFENNRERIESNSNKKNNSKYFYLKFIKIGLT